MDANEKKTCGSLDHGNPAEQMAAIDATMRVYFNTEDWILARVKEFPGPKRT